MKKLHIISLLAVVLYSAPVVCAENGTQPQRSMWRSIANYFKPDPTLASYKNPSYLHLNSRAAFVQITDEDGNKWYGYDTEALGKTKRSTESARTWCRRFTVLMTALFGVAKEINSSEIASGALCYGATSSAVAACESSQIRRLDAFLSKEDGKQQPNVPNEFFQEKLTAWRWGKNAEDRKAQNTRSNNPADYLWQKESLWPKRAFNVYCVGLATATVAMLGASTASSSK